MDLILHILIFLASCFLLAFSGRHLIDSLSKIAKFLGWKEFVVAFFLMAVGASVPNFFVGIISAINKIPQLSFGDVIGGNIIDLSFTAGLAALISREGLSASSRTVQGSAIFTIAIAILPLILIYDGLLSRTDGFLLLLVFLAYIFWLFSKRERFTKVYDGIKEPMSLRFFFKNFGRFLTSLIILILSAQGIVKSASFFSHYLNSSLAIIGILVVGLGDSIPETIFSFQAARRGRDWLMLGDLMGGVVITATLVLAIVALISPIKITSFSSIAISRFFLIIAALFFLVFIRTGRKITKREGIFLLLTYIIFFLVEVLGQ